MEPRSTRPRCAFAAALFAAAVIAPVLTDAYTTGYSLSCPNTFGSGVPEHGTLQSGTSPYALRVLASGVPTTTWTSTASSYTVELYGSTTFRGTLFAVFAGASPTNFAAAKAVTLSPGTSLQAAPACAGAVTHTAGSVTKTSVLATFVPPAAGTGTLTVWGVVVSCRDCGNPQNWEVRVTITEAGAPSTSSSPAASVSASAAPPSPTATASISTGSSPTSTSTQTATPSSSPSRVPSVTPHPYPSATQLLPRMRVRWRLDSATSPTRVDFLLEGTGNIWMGFARSTSVLMVNGISSGSGPAVLGRPAQGTVTQMRLGERYLSAITPVSQQTITNTSIAYNAATDTTTMAFSRPLAATGDESEKAIDPRAATQFIFAHGTSATFDYHNENLGGLNIRLLPDLCTRELRCNGRGSCATTASTSCICDLGYVGTTCQTCAVAHVASASAPTFTCARVVNPPPLLIKVAVKLNLDFSIASTPAWRTAYILDLATALAVQTYRVVIVSITPGSIIVQTNILPHPNASSNEPAPLDAVASLQALISNTSSPLYNATAFPLLSSADPAQQLPLTILDARTYTYTIRLSDLLTVSWRVDGSELAMEARSSAGASTWFAIGINSGPTMVGADVVAYVPSDAAPVCEYAISDRSVPGVVQVAASQRRLTDISVDTTSVAGSVIVRWTRPVTVGAYAGARAITNDTTLIYSVGDSGQQSLARHPLRNAGAGAINFASGTFAAVSLLPAPIRIAHGALMFICWGVLLPLGVGLARFAKNVPPTTGPSAFWFVAHRINQTAALAGAWIAFILALVMVPAGSHFTLPHHRIGLAVMILGSLQPINAALRPHKPKPGEPTPLKRTLWEVLHRGSGYSAIILVVPAIFLGFQVIDASQAFTVAYAVFVAVAGLAFVLAQVWMSCAASRARPTPFKPPPLSEVRSPAGTDEGSPAPLGTNPIAGSV